MGGFLWQNRGRGGAILTPNELVLTFRGSYVCANFGENRSRNATVRVLADGQTDRQTDRQTQTDFIICPMLYAIAMGQIITLCEFDAACVVKIDRKNKSENQSVENTSSPCL